MERDTEAAPSREPLNSERIPELTHLLNGVLKIEEFELSLDAAPPIPLPEGEVDDVVFVGVDIKPREGSKNFFAPRIVVPIPRKVLRDAIRTEKASIVTAIERLGGPKIIGCLE